MMISMPALLTTLIVAVFGKGIFRLVPIIAGVLGINNVGPTLIAWGTDDVFFDTRWSRWLAETIPGTRQRVEFEGARIFFPEERWARFNDLLCAHWLAAG